MTKFEELVSLDVNKYVEKKSDGKQQLSYLSWTNAWREFKKVYPHAKYKIKPTEYDENLGYMVHTEVTADEDTYEMWLPVMNNANRAMKSQPYEVNTRTGKKRVEPATMFDVNKAIMRCLVKNLAMFGLGLYIYAGEDLPEDIKEYVCADCGKPFEAFTDRTGRFWNAGQVFHLAISSAQKKGITDGLARCSNCLNKIINEKTSGGKRK